MPPASTLAPAAAPAAVPSDRLTFTEKLAYGLGDTASNFYFQFFNQFLAFYYREVLAIPAGPLGSLLAWVPIAVAFLNPVIGALADRTNSRWGKFRPWILWGAVPYGLLGFAMFSNPGFGPDGTLVYAYVTYTLTLVAYAAINTPYGALMGVMSPSSEHRTTLSAYRFGGAFLGALAIGWLVPHMTKALQFGGSAADGYRHTMAVFAVVSVAMFLFTFLKTRERVAAPAAAGSSLGDDVWDLVRNVPWLVLFFVAFLNLANVGLRSGMGVFYFKYCVGSETGLGTFNLVGFSCFIAGSLSTKWFTARWSRRSLMIVLTLVNGLGMLAFYFADPTNLPLLYALNIVASFAAGPTPAIVWSLYADTADYGEWRFGRRATGLVFSATVLAQKIGLALGSAMIPGLLDGFGYVPDAAQTAGALQGIRVLFGLLPGLFAAAAGLLIVLYPLDEAKVKQIERDLAQRKAGT